MSGADEDALPVFLNTTELHFRLSEKSQAKLFTLYNPFGHSITYKILCTATRNYTLNETTGTLQAKCCQDIVVRCIQRLPVGNVDKLKIEICKKGAQTSGSCVLNLITVPSGHPDPEETRNNESLLPTNRMSASMTSERGNDRNQANMWACLVVGLFCAIALVCPTAGEPDSKTSSVPPMLHMSAQQKLVASYILGIVSVLILRPM
uniref:Motile sperm domain-containing protein 1 n=1 Tax=Caenorhabditis tropicalis TaxID=1561998 RepID=A0A1I7USH2_9PELO